MNILKRYLAREIYKATALIFVAFLLLFSFFDLIHELGDLGNGDYRLPNILAFVLLKMPGHTYRFIPIAALIGTLYAIAHLAANSEYTVMRTSGFSTGRVILALMEIGVVFAALTFLVGEFIAPPAERAAQLVRLKAMSSVIAKEFRSGLWVKDNMSFINVREVLPDSQLRDIHIYEFDSEFKLRSISHAQQGKYIGKNEWKLESIVQTLFMNQGTKIYSLKEMGWSSVLTPNILDVLLVVPESMSAWHLYHYVGHLTENKQKTGRYEIAFWKKITYPFTSFVMMILALPFAYTLSRSGGVGLRIFSGIMLGMLFHLLNGLFSNLGAINNWPPFLSVIAPSLLFLSAALGMLWITEKR